MVQAGLELPEVFLYPECWDYRLRPHTWLNVVFVVIEKRLKRVGWARCGSGKVERKMQDIMEMFRMVAVQCYQ